MTERVAGGKPRKSIIYTIARGLAYVVFHTLFPLRIHHVERLKRPAPYLLIGNHNSWLDPWPCVTVFQGSRPPFLGKSSWPAIPLTKRCWRIWG